MPLSEHEQRQLEQIEQALYRENRRLGRVVRSSDPRVHYRRRVVQAASGFGVGAGMVAAGVILPMVWLAVGGFAVMLVCGIWALNSWRHMSGVALGVAGRGPGAPAGQRRRRQKNRGNGNRSAMMERFEERWRRRQERGDR